MALLPAQGTTMWQTTGVWSNNWNDFPQDLLRDVELNYQTWIQQGCQQSGKQFKYTYGPTGVDYVIDFESMEQQRQGFGPDDPPRPLRRFPLIPVPAQNVMWQTTGTCATNWNDFPSALMHDVEARYKVWFEYHTDPALARHAPAYACYHYMYGPTGVDYVIDFSLMEQQRQGFGPNDPPRPVRRFPVPPRQVSASDY